MADGVVTIPFPGQSLASDPARPSDLEGPAALSAFLAGPENRLVEPAIEAMLGPKPVRYNPLVFYGRSGTGKSHLARGLAMAWKTAYSGRRIVYVTAIDFVRELADAFETQAVEDFRSRYRDVDLAIFENVGELAGHQAAQEELIRTLDELFERMSQVVVTARGAPAELAELLPGLQSRLSEGLAVPLSAPGPHARLAILRRWAEVRQIDVSEPALRLLAEELGGTVPELLGTMIRLEVPARLDGRAIDARAVREVLVQRDAAQRPQIGEIAATAARHFSLKLADLRGSSRRRPVVVARGVAMFLARLLTKQSLQQIGQHFGGRDHSTVMHACRKIEELLQVDPAIRQAVEQLQRKFQRAASV